ncbi:MAG: divalent-cation tolerance protein CutA [Candidatus Nanohaloarchaea archaeon]
MKLVYVPFPSEEELEDVAEEALERNLAACVNRFPIGSMYLWKGETEREDEVVGLFKTAEDRRKELEEFLEERHPYEVPAIIGLEADVNGSYRDYMGEELEG